MIERPKKQISGDGIFTKTGRKWKFDFGQKRQSVDANRPDKCITGQSPSIIEIKAGNSRNWLVFYPSKSCLGALVALNKAKPNQNHKQNGCEKRGVTSSVLVLNISGSVVNCANSWQRGCELQSYTCQNNNAIGEKGNGKPSHKIPSSRKYSKPCLWFLLRSKSSMRRSFWDMKRAVALWGGKERRSIDFLCNIDTFSNGWKFLEIIAIDFQRCAGDAKQHRFLSHKLVRPSPVEFTKHTCISTLKCWQAWALQSIGQRGHLTLTVPYSRQPCYPGRLPCSVETRRHPYNCKMRSN